MGEHEKGITGGSGRERCEFQYPILHIELEGKGIWNLNRAEC